MYFKPMYRTVRNSYTPSPLKYALIKKSVRSGTTM